MRKILMLFLSLPSSYFKIRDLWQGFSKARNNRLFCTEESFCRRKSQKIASWGTMGLCCLLLIACTNSNEKTNALYHALITNTDGNSQGKITLVEFYDPRCSTCHKMEPVIQNLMNKEPELRVVYHEKPVLGPLSDYASKALIAAKNQDRYLAFRKLLMTSKKPLTKEIILQYAKQAQLNAKLLAIDIDTNAVIQTLNAQLALADYWQVKGTPTYFIGIPNKQPVKLVGLQSEVQLQNVINKQLGK